MLECVRQASSSLEPFVPDVLKKKNSATRHTAERGLVMEVPGIAPGSAKPSPSVSTCVFEDFVSPTAGLLDGPWSTSHVRLAPSRPGDPRRVAWTSPNYRRSKDHLGQVIQ